MERWRICEDVQYVKMIKDGKMENMWRWTFCKDEKSWKDVEYVKE